MKRSGLLTISVVLNVALLLVVFYQRQNPSPNPAPDLPAAGRVPVKIPGRPAPAAPGNSVPMFNWKSVESDDYKVYIQQLRAIGCPEDTIRDLLSADVRKLYEAKRAETRPKPAPKYWEAGFALAGKPDPQQEKILLTLEQEEKQVLKVLLGPGWEQAYRPYPANPEDEARRFGELAADKREKIQASLQKFAALEAELQNHSLSGIMSAQNEQQLNELRQQQRKELAAILTPEELEQYDVRSSETAENLRAGLVGVELNEQEFLEVFRWQKKLDDLSEASTDPFDAQLAQAEKQMEEQTRNLLGEKRFAELQRGNDPDYRDLQQLAKGYDLPAEVVRKVYDLQKQVRQARETMVELNAKGKSRGRNPELIALQRQAAATIKSWIGEKAYETYARRFGEGLAR